MPFTEGADALVTSTVVRPNMVWRSVGGVGNPAFYSNWSNVGGQFQTAQFTVLPSGWIALRGLVQQVGTNVAVFTLPSGYRPAMTEVYESVYGKASCSVLINSSGLVYVEGISGIVPKDLTVSLSGIEFDPL